MILEICAANYQSAINAEKAGAQRIELCENLSVGGITPKLHLLQQILNKLSIPVFVLIRPRAGNFVYTDDEFELMKDDIQRCKNSGCHGIVSGALLEDNSIDVEKTKKLINISNPLPFTFHRAFDMTPDPIKSLEQLIDLGVDRILTSGQQLSAAEGISIIKMLNKKAINKITILPGAGINPNNAKLFKQAGLHEIHASATGNDSVSNVDTIKAILESINA
jgi:copper homeostasis protein